MTKSVKQPQESKSKLTKLPRSKNFSVDRSSKLNLGKWGEHQALKFLLQNDYELIGQNLRLGHSELDLVVLDLKNDELVIVEVRTRSTSWGGHPGESVRGKKWLYLQRTAYHLLKTWNFSKSIRFDIISLSRNGLEHFKNVTWP